jgi:hypothetical protein
VYNAEWVSRLPIPLITGPSAEPPREAQNAKQDDCKEEENQQDHHQQGAENRSERVPKPDLGDEEDEQDEENEWHVPTVRAGRTTGHGPIAVTMPSRHNLDVAPDGLPQ